MKNSFKKLAAVSMLFALMITGACVQQGTAPAPENIGVVSSRYALAVFWAVAARNFALSLRRTFSLAPARKGAPSSLYRMSPNRGQLMRPHFFWRERHLRVKRS